MLQHAGTDIILIVENIISVAHKIHSFLEETSQYRDITARISSTAGRIKELLVAQYAQVEEPILLKIYSELDPIGTVLLNNRGVLQDLPCGSRDEGEVKSNVNLKDLEPIAESTEKLLQQLLIGKPYKPTQVTLEAGDGEITAIAHAELRKPENKAVFQSLANKIAELLATLKQDQQKALETIGIPQSTLNQKQGVLREARSGLDQKNPSNFEKEVIELQISLLERQIATIALKDSVAALKPADALNKKSNVPGPNKPVCHNGAMAMVYIVNTANQLQEVNLSISASELNPSLCDIVLALDILGLSEDARRVSEWRIRLFRSLAKKRLGRFQWVLASLLLHNATWLSKVGRQKDAPAFVEEAVETYRQLTETCPLGFKPELANSLQVLFFGYASTRRSTEALCAIQESVAIRRCLLQRDSPLEDQLRLCAALELLSSTLEMQGRLNEASTPVEEAVKICRPFVQTHPSKVEPILSQLLERLSDRLRTSARETEALESGRESCQVYRKLYRQHPKLYDAPLARALYNLSTYLNQAGHQKESLEVIQESVDLYRQLARDNPSQYEKILPGALHNLSVRLTGSQRAEEAVAYFQEAVTMYRKFVEDQPQLYEPLLAKCLLGLSLALGSLGHKNPAMESIEEAMALFRLITLDEHRETILKQLSATVNVFKQLGWKDHYSCLLAELDYRTREKSNSEQKDSGNISSSLLGYIGSFFA